MALAISSSESVNALNYIPDERLKRVQSGHSSTAFNTTFQTGTEAIDNLPDLKQGIFRYLGYFNELGKALNSLTNKTNAPLLQAASTSKLLVNARRLSGIYTGIDSGLDSYKAWKSAETKRPVGRFWQGLSAGSATWLFQQLSSIVLPAGIVSGIRKGLYNGLNLVPQETILPRAGFSRLLQLLEIPTTSLAKRLVGISQGIPGLKQILAQPVIKKYLPPLAALGSLPLLSKPMDAISQRFVDVTLKPVLNKIGSLPQLNPVTDAGPKQASSLNAPAKKVFTQFNQNTV